MPVRPAGVPPGPDARRGFDVASPQAGTAATIARRMVIFAIFTAL
jgi:hypothetical protein